MVVEDFDPYDGPDVGPPVARQALTHQQLTVLPDGSVVLSPLGSALAGQGWPVSGDATTRAGSIVHRRLRHAANWDGNRRGRAGGWLRRAETVVR